MSKRLTGLPALAYMGVEASTPPQMYLAKRAPTISDSRNFNIGDLWLDESSESLYVLVSLSRGEATWVTTFGGATSEFVTDNGTANESAGEINIVGDGSVLETSGSGNTISIGFIQALDGQLVIGNSGGSAEWGNIVSGDASVIITDGPNSIDLSVNNTVVIGNGTNGQLLIGGGSAPAWASLTSDGSIIITPGVNTLQITAPSATGLTDIDGDTGTATQAAGTVNVVGDGAMIETTGAGNTLTVSILSGTDGQLIMGKTGGPAAWGNLTSMGGTVVITEGPNSINLEATGGGSSGASTFITDSGNALENLGDITIAGGNNIATSGSGQTVTINVDGTTNHALQVGNASGSLTSLAAATNGQLPIGRTGLDPVMSTLTAGSGVTIVNGAGSITISAAGGGGGGTVVTTYNTPGSYTWTKNVDTKFVTVLGWTGGGGGGSGARNFPNGGSGGGSGSFFRFSCPASFLDSSETVVVGAGGTGGAGVTSGIGNAGSNGGISSFGDVSVPVTVAVAFSQSGNQGGAAGGFPSNSGSCSGGAFLLDSMSVQPFTFGTIVNAIPVGGRGGVTSSTVGGDGKYLGGDGGIYYRFVYGLGSSAGAGGSIQTGTPYRGGNGGDIYALNGSDILLAGGVGGNPGVSGSNGNDQLTTGGMIMGGTGGGGGGAQNGGTPAGNGGNGGFPGGGGGGGGGASSGTSGSGGDGGDGLVIVIEWT